MRCVNGVTSHNALVRLLVLEDALEASEGDVRQRHLQGDGIMSSRWAWGVSRVESGGLGAVGGCGAPAPSPPHLEAAG